MSYCGVFYGLQCFSQPQIFNWKKKYVSVNYHNMGAVIYIMSSNSIREVLQYDFSARREICVEECLPKSTFLAKIYEGRILHMYYTCPLLAGLV